MAVNKVVVGSTTKLDLTSDTVTEDTLMSGVTAHDAGGNKITGILSDNLNPELESLTVQGIDYTITQTGLDTLIGMLRDREDW